MAIVDRNKISIIATQGIQAEYDQYTFIIPTLGNNVGVNTSIVWDGGIYKTISVDTTKDGLYIVTGKYEDIYNPHIYSITLNATSDSINETGTYQLTTTCIDNGITQTNPTVIWSSSDSTIATVNNGLVNGIKVGVATITATYMNVSASFNLTVNIKPVTPVISYSTTWSNNNGILLKLASASTVVATKLVDGVQDNSLVVNYVLDATTQSLLSSSKISITKLSNSSYTVKNTNTTTAYTIVITIKDASNGTIIETKTISLKGV